MNYILLSSSNFSSSNLNLSNKHLMTFSKFREESQIICTHVLIDSRCISVLTDPKSLTTFGTASQRDLIFSDRKEI